MQNLISKPSGDGLVTNNNEEDEEKIPLLRQPIAPLEIDNNENQERVNSFVQGLSHIINSGASILETVMNKPPAKENTTKTKTI